MCYIIWQRGIKVTDGMQVADQPTAKQGDHPRLYGLCGPNIVRVREVEDGSAREDQSDTK